MKNSPSDACPFLPNCPPIPDENGFGNRTLEIGEIRRKNIFVESLLRMAEPWSKLNAPGI